MVRANLNPRASAARTKAARARLARAASDEVDGAIEIGAAAKSAVTGYVDQVRDAVAEKPVKSLLIASGIGWVLGFLLRGRS